VIPGLVPALTLDLEVQRAATAEDLPTDVQLQHWAEAALAGRPGPAELVIRIVDELEGADLNERYRHKSGATNVLSFPFVPPPPVQSSLLGDLVICAPVVAREAAQQGKTPVAHWAHLVVHGVLHLLGHDHQSDREAQAMESLERAVLADLGLPDPYAPGQPGPVESPAST
jgi:probable rRNA maturation factor